MNLKEANTVPYCAFSNSRAGGFTSRLLVQEFTHFSQLHFLNPCEGKVVGLVNFPNGANSAAKLE